MRSDNGRCFRVAVDGRVVDWALSWTGSAMGFVPGTMFHATVCSMIYGSRSRGGGSASTFLKDGCYRLSEKENEKGNFLLALGGGGWRR